MVNFKIVRCLIIVGSHAGVTVMTRGKDLEIKKNTQYTFFSFI